MKKFKSPGKEQRFLSAHGPINNLFRPRRDLLKATAYRAARRRFPHGWKQSITQSPRDPAHYTKPFTSGFSNQESTRRTT